MIIHKNATNCVLESSDMIIAKQTIIPIIGTNGTIGVLNGRALSGSFLLMIHTPALTNTKANKVPILVRSPATLPGTKHAKAPTNTNNIKLDL